jgi:hypothetical protein|tara:strand:+ start:38 stop:490 length:453 start_codon:yes stop_codon:yes gene_type:complete
MKPWPTGAAFGASESDSVGAAGIGAGTAVASLFLMASLALAFNFIFIIELIDGFEGACGAGGGVTASDWNLIGAGAGEETTLDCTREEADSVIFYFAYAFNFNFYIKVMRDLSFIYFFTFSSLEAAALLIDANLGGSTTELAGLALINSS